eukprot:gene21594-1221_t
MHQISVIQKEENERPVDLVFPALLAGSIWEQAWNMLLTPEAVSVLLPGSASAFGFLNALNDPEVVSALYLLHEIIPTMNTLIKTMSTSSFFLGSLACEMDLTNHLVNAYADPSLTKLENDSSRRYSTSPSSTQEQPNPSLAVLHKICETEWCGINAFSSRYISKKVRDEEAEKLAMASLIRHHPRLDMRSFEASVLNHVGSAWNDSLCRAGILH